jgi:hypothetical protein
MWVMRFQEGKTLKKMNDLEEHIQMWKKHKNGEE